MSFPHTNYKSEQILSNCLNWKIYCDDHSSLSNFTQLPTTKFFMKTLVSTVNPFSVGGHFNQRRLVWVKANKLFLFDFVTVMLQQERCWVSKN